MIDKTDLAQIQNIISPMLNHKAWGVYLGLESFVILEFGSPITHLTKKNSVVHGEWHVWVYDCAWRLEKGNEVIGGSSDPREHLTDAVKIMNDLMLQPVVLTPPSLETTFFFEQEVSLHLFPVSTQDRDADQWRLYLPDGKVLVIGPGSSWSHEDASKPRP